MVVFIDDILIYSAIEEQHREHLGTILQTLRKHKLYVKLSKCEIEIKEVKFLGNVVSGNGVSIDDSKIEAIARWEYPSNA